jgi:hypothetical protein
MRLRHGSIAVIAEVGVAHVGVVGRARGHGHAIQAWPISCWVLVWAVDHPSDGR